MDHVTTQSEGGEALTEATSSDEPGQQRLPWLRGLLTVGTTLAVAKRTLATALAHLEASRGPGCALPDARRELRLAGDAAIQAMDALDHVLETLIESERAAGELASRVTGPALVEKARLARASAERLRQVAAETLAAAGRELDAIERDAEAARPALRLYGGPIVPVKVTAHRLGLASGESLATTVNNSAAGTVWAELARGRVKGKGYREDAVVMAELVIQKGIDLDEAVVRATTAGYRARKAAAVAQRSTEQGLRRLGARIREQREEAEEPQKLAHLERQA